MRPSAEPAVSDPLRKTARRSRVGADAGRRCGAGAERSDRSATFSGQLLSEPRLDLPRCSTEATVDHATALQSLLTGTPVSITYHARMAAVTAVAAVRPTVSCEIAPATSRPVSTRSPCGGGDWTRGTAPSASPRWRTRCSRCARRHRGDPTDVGPSGSYGPPRTASRRCPRRHAAPSSAARRAPHQLARRHPCGCPYESDRVGDPSSPTPDSLSWRMPPRAGPEESPSMGRQRPSRCPRMRNRQVPNYPEPDLPSLSHERACRSAPMACHTSLGHGERTDGLRWKVGPARFLPARTPPAFSIVLPRHTHRSSSVHSQCGLG